jgi:phenylalanyl-tRNA synthetase beta subunit
MTINAKQQEKMKRSESIPFLNPMTVEMDDTRAEWLEGMPPVFQKSTRLGHGTR